MWRPLESVADIPPEGTRESFAIDFKAKLDADDFEIAKDAAAFSNAHGGTILIGAAGRDKLSKLLPMTEGDAKEAARRVEESIRDRCRPAPFFETREIAVEGGLLVSVNVWPSPGQVVGVHVKKTEVSASRKPHHPEDVYCFPLRIGSNTRNLTPEQLPMFMDPKTRRVATALGAYVGQDVVLLAVRRSSDEGLYHQNFKLRGVDVLRNLVELELPMDGKEHPVSVPLDLVVSVCPAEHGCVIYTAGEVHNPVEWVDPNHQESEPLRRILRGYFFSPRD